MKKPKKEIEKPKKEIERPGRRQMFVRVDGGLGDWFRSFCTEAHRHEAEVIEILISYFHGLEPPERADILGARVVPGFSKLILRLEWANHAFSKRFWPWTLEEYQQVEVLADKLNASGIAWLSRYKQAYCWLDIALFWRDKAIQDGVELFKRAQKATLNAIFLNQRYLIHHKHRVIYYNIGCGWALYARLCVEEKLISIDPTWAKKLMEQEAWNEIGGIWRKQIVDEKFKNDIKSYGQKAMKGFQRMASAEEDLVPADFSYLLNRWDSDTDLLFLRMDAEFRDSFSKFAKQNLNFIEAEETFEKLSTGITDVDRSSVFQSLATAV